MAQQIIDIVGNSQPDPVVRLVTIDERHQGQRLDNFLISQLKGVPKTRIYRMLRTGEVRINKGRAHADSRVEIGDIVRIPPVRTAKIEPVQHQPWLKHAQTLELPVIFEDDHLLVIDKPRAVAVHGGSGVDFGVIEALRSQRGDKFLELVHRLDRDTSGLLVLAKRRSALVWCQEQFRQRSTYKEYRAVVWGKWPRRTKTLRWPLYKTINAHGERHVYVRDDGKPSISHVLGLRQNATLMLGKDNYTISEVAVQIETGRTHQIRVHLSHAGFPIVGDERYGEFARNKLISASAATLSSAILVPRMYLHAYKLRIRHPESQEVVEFVCPAPEAFDRAFVGA